MSRVSRAAATALALAAALGGCGGDGGDVDRAGDLSWEEGPQVVRHPELPNDRLLTGVLRNDSLRRIRLRSRDLEVRTGAGNPLTAVAIFSPTYAHGVFPQNRGERMPESEQLRLGLQKVLRPGETTPLTMAWRQRPGTAAPVRLDYGRGSLPLR